MSRLTDADYHPADLRPGLGVNFVNWFQMHADQEKIAMEICGEMKLNIVPAYVQLARAYRELFEKQNRTLTENELIFDYTKLADTNAQLARLLDDFQANYASNGVRLNPLVDLRSGSLAGLLGRPDFGGRKWMKIFNLCELTACKLLYSMIAFLDQNLFISSNIPLREHSETANYFFRQNLESFITGMVPRWFVIKRKFNLTMSKFLSSSSEMTKLV